MWRRDERFWGKPEMEEAGGVLRAGLHDQDAVDRMENKITPKMLDADPAAGGEGEGDCAEVGVSDWGSR